MPQKEDIFELPLFSEDEQKAASIYFDIVELFINFEAARDSYNEDMQSKSLLSILKYLEQATWNIEDQKRTS